MKYEDLTRKIIGCAMKVHGTLGNGFPALIYQRALAIEMHKKGLSFVREIEMPVYYDGHNIGACKVDFFVENLIMVDIKALLELDNAHLVQAKNNLEAFNMEVGLLFNFGSVNLMVKRLENNKFRMEGYEKG